MIKFFLPSISILFAIQLWERAGPYSVTQRPHEQDDKLLLQVNTVGRVVIYYNLKTVFMDLNKTDTRTRSHLMRSTTLNVIGSHERKGCRFTQ